MEKIPNCATAFAELIATCATKVKPHGYVRRGATLRCRLQDYETIINFQKSSKSTSQAVEFTVNLGVCSLYILSAESPEEPVNALTIQDCQWHERLGFLLPSRSDVWWRVDDSTDNLALSAMLANSLEEIAVPLLANYANDVSLLALWKTERSPGIGALERMIFQSLLMKRAGQLAEVDQVLSQLRAFSAGKPWAWRAEQHILTMAK
jgi:hypothetical protein